MPISIYFPTSDKTIELQGSFPRKCDVLSRAAELLLKTEPARKVLMDLIQNKCSVIRYKENMQELIPEVSVKGYADINPKLLIYYGNLRFSAYRVLNRGRSKAPLTEAERELILADQDSFSDKENFLGTYYVVPHVFELISKPYCIDLPCEEEARILSECSKGRRKFSLSPETYKVEIL